MKELKLLDEDWKGEIDYSKADVLVSKTGIYVLRFEFEDWFVSQHGAFEKLANIEKFGGIKEAYKREHDELVRIKPEPRPADSIKLSKCDGRHIIVGLRNNDTCKAVYSGNEWHLSSGVGNVIDHRDDLVFLLFNMAVTNIKIYDMSK